MSRRSEREQAMHVIFQSFFNKFDCYKNEIEAYRAGVGEQSAQGAFFEELVRGVSDKSGELLKIIEKYAQGWKIERISKVAIAILEIALYEILYIDDIPQSVSANEAVELSKAYEPAESAAFINGILGSFLRSDDMKGQK